MNIVLHLATSSDGFIAKADGDSNWVSPIDEKLFVARVKSAGCVVIGKKTFEQYQGSIYPVEGALNIVLTTDTSFMSADPNVTVARSPEEAIVLAEKQGHQSMVIAGGARTSSAFLDAGLINEIFLSVHPLKLGSGIRPFEDLSLNPNYKLLGQKQLDEGIRELHYVMI